MRSHAARLIRARLTHYWDQHPLHRLRLRALRNGGRAALCFALAAAILRLSPAVVVVGLTLLVELVATRDAFGRLLDARWNEEQDERTAVRLRAAVEHRRRTVQRLLDA